MYTFACVLHIDMFVYWYGGQRLTLGVVPIYYFGAGSLTGT